MSYRNGKKIGVLVVLLLIALTITGCNSTGNDPEEAQDTYITKTISSVEEFDKVLANLKEDDKAIITLEGSYENKIEINDSYTFSELTLKANKKHEAVISNEISFENTKNVTLKDFIIEKSKNNGIVINQSENISLENNIIRDNNYFGILVLKSNLVIIENNDVKNNGLEEEYPGIKIENESEVEIINSNKIANNKGNGIFVKNSKANIKNSLISDNSVAGVNSKSSTVTAENNTILNNENRGLSIYDGSTAAIEGNEIANHSNDYSQGIGLANSDVNINDNNIHDNTMGIVYSNIKAVDYGNEKIVNNQFKNNDIQVIHYIESQEKPTLLKNIYENNTFEPESDIVKRDDLGWNIEPIN